jgi:hypothetical protein
VIRASGVERLHAPKAPASDEMRTPSAIIFDLRCRIVSEILEQGSLLGLGLVGGDDAGSFADG